MSASRSNLLPRLSIEEGRNKSKSNHVRGDEHNEKVIIMVGKK
jgi:hypothetical protein